MKKNTENESLAAKRERLVKEEAIRRQGEQEADELQRQKEELAEAAVGPSLSLRTWVNVVTVVLIIVASMLWQASPLASWLADVDSSLKWILLVLSVASVLSGFADLSEDLGSAIAVRRWQSTEALIVSSESQVVGHTAHSGPVLQPVASL